MSLILKIVSTTIELSKYIQLINHFGNNVEITIERDDSNNEYLLKGFAWDYSQGYKEITKKFLINPEVIGTFNDDDLKIFFFDEKEIYVESNDSVFTGIYKKY